MDGIHLRDIATCHELKPMVKGQLVAFTVLVLAWYLEPLSETRPQAIVVWHLSQPVECRRLGFRAERAHAA